MKKFFPALIGIVFCFFLLGIHEIRAQEDSSADVNLKQELVTEKQQVKEQHQEINQAARSGIIEENKLREKISAAIKANDLKTANQLKQQLRAIHTANLEAMMEDNQKIQLDKNRLKNDVNETGQENYLSFQEGEDNNLSDLKGGPGTK
jgi:hypothetical protein